MIIDHGENDPFEFLLDATEKAIVSIARRHTAEVLAEANWKDRTAVGIARNSRMALDKANSLLGNGL